jgi:cytochrome P450
MSVVEIDRALQRKAGQKPSRDSGHLKSSTIFDHLVNSDLPSEELTTERLASEAQVLMGAGTVTTAASLSHLVVYILSHSHVETRLRAELSEAASALGIGVALTDRHLERLQYLQASIREASGT